MNTELGRPPISVIVVACDSGDLLGASVERVLANATPCELWVVDNASRDGSVDAIAKRHAGDTRLRILRNTSNLGFGRACNQAAGLAGGSELLFLNPDCLIEADALSRLSEAIAANSDLGLVGAAMVDSAGVPEAAARRREPSLGRAALSALGLRGIADRAPSPTDANSRAMPVGLEDVEAVSGALMYLPRRVFERLSGFDEGYFLHCEDLDLCRRVRDLGMRVAVLNSLRAVHFKGTSSRARALFVLFHKHRGMWRYFRKFDPLARRPLLAPLVCVAIWARFFLLSPLALWQALRARSTAADIVQAK